MKKIILSITITLIITLGVFVFYFFVVRSIFSSMSDRGLFGDMFGGINALFSGLAFLGVIYAVILQREELQLQRKELKLTREELKKSVEAQEKSEQALSKQAASLKATAKLNGLGAELQYYSMRAEVQATGRWNINEQSPYVLKAENVLGQIDDIIADK